VKLRFILLCRWFFPSRGSSLV